MSIHEGLHSHLVGTTAKGGNGETVTHSLIYLEAVDPVRLKFLTEKKKKKNESIKDETPKAKSI